MKLRPVDNWKTILSQAWSAHGMYLLAFSGVVNDYVVPLIERYFYGGSASASPGFGTFVSIVAGITLFLRVMQQVLPLIDPEKKDD